MNKNIPFVFACLLFFAASCKKEKYSDVSPPVTSVFYYQGIMDGESVNLKAGVNDYYMYSSYSQDANNVYNFLGEFKQTNCATCNDRIQFQFNDFQVSSPGVAAAVNTSLIPAYYSLQVPGGAPTKYPVIFISQPSNNDIAQTYSWSFGDGTVSSDINPIHPYMHPGVYDVCLTITYASSCVSNICNQVRVG